MKKEERVRIEKVIIKSFFYRRSNLELALEKGFTSDSFSNSEVQNLFNHLLNYYDVYGKYPETDEFFGFLTENSFMEDADSCKKLIIDDNIMIAGYAGELLNEIQHDNIENQFWSLLDKLKKEYKGIDLVSTIGDEIFNLISKSHEQNKHEEDIKGTLQEIIDRLSNKSSLNYIPTGIKAIDEKIIGVHKGSLTIIAARPGMGKTSMACQLIRNFVNQGNKVGFFSIEMKLEDLMIKELSEATGIDSLKIEALEVSEHEKNKLKSAANEIIKRSISYDTSGYQTPSRIKSKISIWKAQGKADVIVIDYITLIKTFYKKNRNDLEIGELSNELSRIAKMFNIPIIVLSQLNRSVESRTDKIPMLSDLRESGSIEQDARTVIFLNRPVAYGLEMPKNLSFFSIEAAPIYKQPLKPEEYLQAIIAKNRGGKVGRTHLRYQKEIHRISELIVCGNNEKSVPHIPQNTNYQFSEADI